MKKFNYRYLGLIGLVLIILISYPLIFKKNKFDIQIGSMREKCPSNLSGILKYPFIDPNSLFAITPLGNLNPPGHTSPVDHNYLHTNLTTPIPLYSPADGVIKSIASIMYKDDNETEYTPMEFVVSIEVCKGLVLDFAGYTDLVPEIDKVIAENKGKDCKYGIKKDGHDKTEGQCYFETKIETKSGQLLGYSQKIDGKFPLEIWAANYNIKPSKEVDWDFYNDDRYAHIVCMFDLYPDDIKEQYSSLFGGIAHFKDEKGNKSNEGTFIKRTVEPLCGTVHQNIKGSIQGMWYGGSKKEENLEFQGKGLAIVHDNVDPTKGAISIGGNFMEKDTIIYTPTHTGFINREPSEVTADGNIYCYNARNEDSILIQLIDDKHLKVEHKNTICSDDSMFIKPFNYQR